MITSIDMQTYPRKQHFEHFLAMDNPFTSITIKVDITDWLVWQKSSGHPFFLCFQYAVTQAANQVAAFRQRIKDGGIVEYDFCNPSYTVGLPDGTYRYCLVHADQPLESYLEEGKRKQEEALKTETLKEEGDVLGHLFTTCVPWFSFTGLDMPWPGTSFSNPNIGWGRYEREIRLVREYGEIVDKEIVTIPVVIMVNHALVDGKHIADFIENLNKELAKMAE